MQVNDSLVSVLMCVHNEDREYLNVAIQSICYQTYRNIELIIVDDASNEECKAELSRINSIFSIIRIIHNKENLGITKSLNVGLLECRGKYISRMDADDFSHPKRIERQLKYMERHPDIDIVGCGVVTFGEKHMFYSPAFGMGNENAQCELLFTSTLCHPAVMIISDFLRKNHLQYNPSVNKGQDFDLWERASVYGKLAVMSEVLLYYRIHSNQISSKKNDQQIMTARMVMTRRLGRLGLAVGENEFEAHNVLVGMSSNESARYKEWADKILEANKACGLLSQKKLNKNLALRKVAAKYRIFGNGRIGTYSVAEYGLLLKIFISRMCMALALNVAEKKFKKAYKKLKEKIV
jgi:glycosyltransferase involved in cell wall biosynthesis